MKNIHKILLIISFISQLLADEFFLDQEKRKNPVVFSVNPESLTKEQLVRRVRADEKGLSEYSAKINSLKKNLKYLQSKVISVTAENKRLKDEQDTYLEKIEKLSSRLGELESILTVEPSDQKDIHLAYKRLQQEYKRLELSSAIKGNDGYKVLQLERENEHLKRQLNSLLRDMGHAPIPRAYIDRVGVSN